MKQILERDLKDAFKPNYNYSKITAGLPLVLVSGLTLLVATSRHPEYQILMIIVGSILILWGVRDLIRQYLANRRDPRCIICYARFSEHKNPIYDYMRHKPMTRTMMKKLGLEE